MNDRARSAETAVLGQIADCGQVGLIEQFRSAIQTPVDTTAQSRNYGDGNSLASYVASTTWAAEATAFVAWRDAVWIYAYAELDKVTAGEREVPTVEAFIGELPVIRWDAR